MAPTPNNVEEVTVVYIDGMAVYKKEAPPASSSTTASPVNHQGANIPSVITETLYPTAPAQPVVTAAFLINSFWNSYQNSEITYTISQFNNLQDAAVAASSLQAAAAVLSAEDYPYSEMTAQFGSYRPTSTSTEEVKPAVTAAASSESSSLSSVATTQQQDHHHGPPVTGIVVGVVVPIIVIIIILISCLFCIRHYKRKARRAQAAQMAQRAGEPLMEVGGAGDGNHVAQRPIDVRAHISTPGDALAMPSTTAAAAAATTTPPLTHDQPIILSNTISDNYFTGIDTSDAVSMNESQPTVSERQDLHAETFGEDEPPPPYRPRSVPPISRDTSVRTSSSIPPPISSSIREDRTLATGPEPSAAFAAKDLRRSIAERSMHDRHVPASMRGNEEPGSSSNIRDSHMPISDAILRDSSAVRSPFDDPESDESIDEADAASFVSMIRPDEAYDPTQASSEVSDLEYQESIEPMRGHSSL